MIVYCTAFSLCWTKIKNNIIIFYNIFSDPNRSVTEMRILGEMCLNTVVELI